MSILVTGTTDVVARHLLELLPRERGPLVAAGLRLPSGSEGRADVRYIACDLREFEEAKRLIEELQPTEIVHLAGRFSVHAGEEDAEETILGNLAIARCILEASRIHAPRARILFQSGAEVYGRGPKGRGAEFPRVEEDPLVPLSTAGTSLASCEILARQYALAHNLSIMIVRPFNVLGPYQSRQSLVPRLAADLARLKLAKGEPTLYAGDLELTRDYVDARDVARAYRLLLQDGKPGETYNVCTGRPAVLRQVAEELANLAGGSIELRVDPRRERAAEIPMLVGSNEKIKEHVGWVPAIPLRDTLKDLYREMLARIAAERKG